MNRKSYAKKKFMMSVLSLVLTVAMLIGTTFAWFTDSVTSGKNTITAGNLDIDVLHTSASVTTAETIQGDTELFRDASGNAITWEPGVISYENFTVKNLGTLALKYKLAMNITDYNALDTHTLKEVLKVKVLTGNDILSSITRETVQALDWNTSDTLDVFKASGDLLVNETDDFQVIVYWQPTANDNLWNVNNGQTTSDGQPLFVEFGIDVVATQLNSESDSFDQNYDLGIVLPDLPISINKRFESAPITTKTVTESVVVKNKSTNDGVATVQPESVNGIVAALETKATDKAETSDISTVLYLDVSTVAKTETTVTYNIDLSAVMTYKDTNGVTQTKTIDNNNEAKELNVVLASADKLVVAKAEIGKGLSNVSVKHQDTTMTALTSADQDAEGFFYDKTEGVLTIKSKSFSPFTISYDLDAVAIVGGKAYATLGEALDAAKENETVVLTKDANLTSYAAGKGHVFDLKDGITIALNNHKITTNNYGVVFKGSNLIIKNGSIEAANGGSYALFVGDETATTGVTLEKLTCTGGINLYNTTAAIKDCNVTGTKYYAVWAEGANVAIQSGTYSSQSTEVGTPTAVSADGNSTISITGGTYCSDPSVYVASGYEATKDTETGLWTVAKEAVAKIGTKGYGSIQEAVTAAVNNDTITMMKNVTTDTVIIPAELTVSLDLNGKTIAGNVDATKDNNLINGYKPVIKNLGTLTVSDTSTDAKGKIYNASTAISGNQSTYIVLGNVGTITIEKGWFGDSSIGKSGSAIRSWGTATINNGHFTIGQGDRSSRTTASYSISMNGGMMTVNGGEVYGSQRGFFGISGTGTAGSAKLVVNNFSANVQKYNYVVYADNGAIVEVNGGVYKSEGWSKNCMANAFCVDNYEDVGTSVTINAGTFTHGNYSTYGKSFDWCYYSPEDDYIGAIIKGGTFDMNPASSNGHNYVAEGYQSVQSGNNWTVVAK